MYKNALYCYIKKYEVTTKFLISARSNKILTVLLQKMCTKNIMYVFFYKNLLRNVYFYT